MGMAGLLAMTGLLVAAAGALAGAPVELDRYNVVWDTPSANEAGSMPLGNGRAGINLWVEEDGDLLFYVARNDAHSEMQRLMKLGRIRVSLSPNPFVKGSPFRQELRLREGAAFITAGQAGSSVTLRVFVDAATDVVHVAGSSQTPVTVTAKLDSWRTVRRELKGPELASSWVYRDAPEGVAAWESADTFLGEADAVTWYHRNAWSVVPEHVRRQGLGEHAGLVTDTLKDNTFGARMTGAGMRATDRFTLTTTSLSKTLDIRLASLAAQTPTAEDWLRRVTDVSLKSAPPAEAARRTARWWGDFWGRSWLFASGNEAAERVTRAYVLSKWVMACQARSEWPVRFQGGFFTVNPKFAGYGPAIPDEAKTPDYRFYGVNFWFQNTRLLYHPMLAQGSFDLMAPFFRLYAKDVSLAEARAEHYFGAKGVYFQECSSTFGLPGMGDYGWDQPEPSQYSEPYTRNMWQQPLELALLMLDYASYTGDDRFLRETAVPWSIRALAFFDTRFKRDARGILVIEPTKALETYWDGVVNDMPSVAGLHALKARLMALPSGRLNAAERTVIERMAKSLPALPTRVADAVSVPDMAEKYEPNRANYETPDLYSIFPFRQFGIGKPGLDGAVKAWRERRNPSSVCWYQDGINAALLGLTEDARKDVERRSSLVMPGFRFPGFFTSPHDWCPDLDGPANLMTALQFMLLQADGDVLRLQPAWPADWDVSFRLHAPGKTVLEGVYRNGRMQRLKVTPASRSDDVAGPKPFPAPS